jgi:amino-acid N-acetyltransferase
MEIGPAGARDLEPLCALLAAMDLPTEGLREHLGTALVAREGDDVVGCVALEVYGDAALLRSLAVVPSRQGAGIGRRLAQEALSLGRRSGVTTFCLLTTTAPDFFGRHFAFRPVARDAVPAGVRQSVEFISACPATARAMMLRQARAQPS